MNKIKTIAQYALLTLRDLGELTQEDVQFLVKELEERTQKCKGEQQ